MRDQFQKLKLVDVDHAEMPTVYRGGATTELSNTATERGPNMLRNVRGNLIAPSVSTVKAAIHYAKDLFSFVKDFTVRGKIDFDEEGRGPSLHHRQRFR